MGSCWTIARGGWRSENEQKRRTKGPVNIGKSIHDEMIPAKMTAVLSAKSRTLLDHDVAAGKSYYAL